MKIYHALHILSGTITEDGADWYELGYDAHKFRAYGKPSWDDVKAKAARTIALEFEDLVERIKRLEKSKLQ